MNDQKYDWIVVGGGIAGISVAEILCREGKSVLIIEKNSQIASETSKVFHEWLHTGALYSLVPDNLITTRYLLGAMDDLLDYYSFYNRMNLTPSENGLLIGDYGWFNNDRIEYRYRVRKLNPIWMSMVSRAMNIGHLINTHDWLRRNAGGSEYDSAKIKLKYSFDRISEQFSSSDKFLTLESPDFTMNSRILMGDLLSTAVHNGLEIAASEPVESIFESGSGAKVETSANLYESDNVVICSPDVVSKEFNVPINTGYAPMAVVDNVPESEKSFVELDYYTKTCINLLKKENRVGLAGGITVNKEKDIKPYLKYIIMEHKKRNPEIRVVDDYVGLKRELVQDKDKRNYLYHINQHSSKIWSVVLGKFSLSFSMAPEFYRRVYVQNPKKLSEQGANELGSSILSKTSWREIIDNNQRDN
jgi:hypothetical protein